MADLLAHIVKINGERADQSLKDHCFQTAEYAAEKIEDGPENGKLYNVRYLAGILHDMGKSRNAAQEYLEESYRGGNVVRGSVVHTFQGCIYLLEKYHRPECSVWEKRTSEIIAYAVGAHHGLFDCVDLDGNNGFIHRLGRSKQDIGYDECKKNFFEQVVNEQTLEKYFYKATEEVQDFCKEVVKHTDRENIIFFQIGLLTRLVLSYVVYGDRRDTSEFMRNIKLKECEISWDDRIRHFEEKYQKLDDSTELNKVRKEISSQCLKFAERPCGIYRLNAPTSGGKTMAALRYALAHAKKYNKKRVIFIIPLLNVLDQNAKNIRDYLPGHDEILEHHSNVIQDNSADEKNDKKEALDYFELLTERWSSPIIVSTLVQLLEILFSDKMSAVERMHALCDSVLVIDEVQSLPKRDTAMFNMALNFLGYFCNTTIILSSATLPCLENMDWPLWLSVDPDMVHLTPQQLELFKRCNIVDCIVTGGMSWDDCEQFCRELIAKHSSVLMIANTKESARTIYNRLKKDHADCQCEVVHLSASMCQQHRLDIMEQIKEKLDKIQKKQEDDEKPIFCVSTRLMEAGVDVSFEAVVSVIAGVDNLNQAAGRCNRSNEYGDFGTIYLINLKEERLNHLKEIKKAQTCTKSVLERMDIEQDSLIGEAASTLFYEYIYKEMEKELLYPVKIEGENYNLANLLTGKISTDHNKRNNDYCLRQPFKIIGKTFKVFDDATIDVIVPYKAGKSIIEKIKNSKSVDDIKKLIKKAKLYTISIYSNEMETLRKHGLVSSVLDGRVWILDKAVYDSGCGFIGTNNNQGNSSSSIGAGRNCRKAA